MFHIYIKHKQSPLPFSSVHPFFLIHPSLCQLKNVFQSQFGSTQIVLALWSSRVVNLPGLRLSEKLSLSLYLLTLVTDFCKIVCPSPFSLLGSCSTWAYTGFIHDVTSVVSSDLYLTHSIQMITFSYTHQLPQALVGLLILKYFVCLFFNHTVFSGVSLQKNRFSV